MPLLERILCLTEGILSSKSYNTILICKCTTSHVLRNNGCQVVFSSLAPLYGVLTSQSY